MSVNDPYRGFYRVLASMPERWKAVTPHATNYLEGDASNHTVAVALMSVDGGVISYRDAFDPGTTKTIELVAGQTISGKFTRVMVSGTTSTKIYAGFIGEPVA